MSQFLRVMGRTVPAVRMTQRSKYKSKQAQRYLDYKQTVGWVAKSEKIRQLKTDVEVTAKAHLHVGSRDMDVDNIAKTVLDSLNGIAWIDDRQVVTLTVSKVFVHKDFNELLEIEIKEVSA